MSIIYPRGIIPALYIDPSKRAEALAWIRSAPYGSSFRKGLLRGWAAELNLRVTEAEYEYVGWGSVPRTAVDVKSAVAQLESSIAASAGGKK
jgi:hypothetical protein